MSEQEQLNICVLGNAWSPHIQNRTRSLAEMGHEVTLLSADSAEIAGVPVTKITPAWSLPLCGWTILFTYLKEIRRINPDVIHIHYASGFHAWATLLLPEYPMVVSLMGRDILFEEQGNPSKGSIGLTLDVLEAAFCVTSKSAHINDYMEKVAPKILDKTEIIRWGIDPSEFYAMDSRSLRTELGVAPDVPILLCPRGFGPVYNIEIILQSLNIIRRKHHAAKLLLFEFRQDHGYRKHLDKVIIELGLGESIVIVGDVPHREMPRYYGLADVVISIPSSDGMPQSLFEALACESALIISNLPHYEEIVKNEREVLTTSIDAESVAAATSKLLEDESLRRSLGQAGRAMVLDKANFKKDATRVEKILRRAANESPSRKRCGFFRFARLLVWHYVEAILMGKDR